MMYFNKLMVGNKLNRINSIINLWYPKMMKKGCIKNVRYLWCVYSAITVLFCFFFNLSPLIQPVYFFLNIILCNTSFFPSSTSSACRRGRVWSTWWCPAHWCTCWPGQWPISRSHVCRDPCHFTGQLYPFWTYGTSTGISTPLPCTCREMWFQKFRFLALPNMKSGW